MTVKNTGAGGNVNNRKNIIIKNCAPFAEYIGEISNKQIDHTKDIDAVILTNSLIESSDDYWKTSVGLWQYYSN